MDNTQENPVLDRIKKLLKLAEHCGSEAEAAVATQRAAELMAKHEIHEATVRVNLWGDAPEQAEEISTDHKVTNTTKCVAWHMALANGAAYQFHCKTYFSNGAVALFGRLSAVQAATYVIQYLINEVTELADEEAPIKEFTKSYRNAFRLACSYRIRDRMIEAENAKAKTVKSEPATIFDEIFEEEGYTPEPQASDMVLAVVEKDREQVDNEYEKFSKRFRSIKVGSISSGDGYAAGKIAGNSVRLPGGARGALPRGQGSLK